MEKEKLLEKYLQSRLSEAERRQFEVLLKSDPDFKEEVEFQFDVRQAVTVEEDESFMSVLSDFESDARIEEQRTAEIGSKEAKKLPTKWLVAASIAVLVGLTYFFTAIQTADPQDLFAENFKPYRNVTHPLTRGEEAADMKTKAFLAYSKGEYNDAIPLFTELYTSGNEPYYLFYKANALIQLNRAGEAVPLLVEHLKTQDSLTDKTNWYLAMAYLQLEDLEKARQALKTVVETNAYKAEDAKQLLDAL